MTARPEVKPQADSRALFSRVSRSSERAILPVTSASEGTGDVPAFYCVHSVSGAAGTDFIDLALRLEPSVRFFGIQAPPRQMLEADFGTSVESLAAYYADALDQYQPAGPIILGGYCVGAVIAMEMANILRARGRDVGPLIAIDGMPENVGGALRRWQAQYWAELTRNVPSWFGHADLMRNRSLRSFIASLSKNLSAIAHGIGGLGRGQAVDRRYPIERLMDLSLYPAFHRAFIRRLFKALLRYVPKPYRGEVAVYEARTTPLLHLPQVGRTWLNIAPRTTIVSILGTHIGMMHEPYVDALAEDLRERIVEFMRLRPAGREAAAATR